MRSILAIFAAVAVVLAAPTAEKRIAIVIDTSGSMNENDRPRYTVQLSQILADLLSPGDKLSVTRLPTSQGSCADGPIPALSIELGTRPVFQTSLNGLIRYGGENYFASTLHAAMEKLGTDPTKKRLLLMIADSGGLDTCETSLTAELDKFHSSGSLIAAINIGSSAGAFETNPAFDFRTPALNSEQLVQAVAQVYQRFLGSNKVQTGRVQGADIEVTVDPYVREAFLVVAADGSADPLQPASGNPTAASVDPDHLGGGSTRGLDGVRRVYRIAKMVQPSPGTWKFHSGGLTTTAGWMLLQDYALALQTTSATQMGGAPSTLELQLIDETTGKPVTDFSHLKDLNVDVEVDGQKVHLTPSSSNPGILTGQVNYSGPGKKTLHANLRTGVLDRTFLLETSVIEAGWRLIPQTEGRLPVAVPARLKVRVETFGSGKAPERLVADVGGTRVELTDAGAGVFSGLWTPDVVGPNTVTFSAASGPPGTPATQNIDVFGHMEIGPVPACSIGPLRSRMLEGSSAVDLSAAKIQGAVDLEFRSAFSLGGTALEIDTGSGWTTLGSAPVHFRLDTLAPRSIPVRLRVADCPQSSDLAEPRSIDLKIPNYKGGTDIVHVPLRIGVIGDSWLHCWWRILVAIAAALFVAFVIYGFVSPSRFNSKIGVMIANEEDVNQEGFWHPIAGARGSASGFYRDARVYICRDHRVSGSRTNGVARLRAHRGQVRLQPVQGQSLFRQSPEGEWVELKFEESSARAGTLYRDESATIYFEIRTQAVSS